VSTTPGIFSLPEGHRLCLAPFQYGKTLILPSDALFALFIPFQRCKLFETSLSCVFVVAYGTLSYCIPSIALETTCMREYLATKTRHRLAFCSLTSAPPRHSRRLLFGAHTTGADNHRGGCQSQHGMGIALRTRTMSTEDNLASASDETESDDEVHRSGMPTCGLGF
jgi:hypothetical protein